MLDQRREQFVFRFSSLERDSLPSRRIRWFIALPPYSTQGVLIAPSLSSSPGFSAKNRRNRWRSLSRSQGRELGSTGVRIRYSGTPYICMRVDRRFSGKTARDVAWQDTHARTDARTHVYIHIYCIYIYVYIHTITQTYTHIGWRNNYHPGLSARYRIPWQNFIPSFPRVNIALKGV